MQTEPRTGDIFLCLKGNREHGVLKGEHYLYDNGQLKRFTRRNVTALLNGDELLALPNSFVLSPICPFCNCALPVGGPHNGVECANDWDHQVKKY